MSINNNEIIRQAVIFGRARGNLLVIVAFTLINLFLSISDSSFSFFFSAFIPSLIIEFALSLGSNTIWMGSIIVAFGIVFAYYLCWMLSKRQRAWILVALILFSIDALIFLFIVIFAGFLGEINMSLLIQVAFYGWIMYYLITGTVAWAKLKNLSSRQIMAAHRKAVKEIASAESDKALKNLSPDDEKEEDGKNSEKPN